ncbi:hypothetical protein VXQ08_10315, partial [Acinetobacter towneri]
FRGIFWFCHWNILSRKLVSDKPGTVQIFPTDDSVKKVVYLAIMAASKKWTMPIQNWKAAMNRFSIMFEERVTKYF